MLPSFILVGVTKKSKQEGEGVGSRKERKEKDGKVLLETWVECYLLRVCKAVD